MTAQTTTRIYVTTSPLTEDDATGNGATEMTVDLDASNHEYGKLLGDALRTNYPECEFDIEFAQVSDTLVVTSPMADNEDEIHERVRDILGTIYGQGEFWVEA